MTQRMGSRVPSMDLMMATAEEVKPSRSPEVCVGPNPVSAIGLLRN